MKTESSLPSPVISSLPACAWFTEGFDPRVLKQAQITALATHNVNEIRNWLEGIGLGQKADAFEANDIEVDPLTTRR
jgi:hypothetical protein